jgi:hypothetical protein
MKPRLGTCSNCKHKDHVIRDGSVQLCIFCMKARNQKLLDTRVTAIAERALTQQQWQPNS